MGMGYTKYTKSRFRYRLGVIAFVYVETQAIAPPNTSKKIAPPFINGKIGIANVINTIRAIQPMICHFSDHSSTISFCIGDVFLFAFKFCYFFEEILERMKERNFDMCCADTFQFLDSLFHPTKPLRSR